MKHIKIVLIGWGLVGCNNQLNNPTPYGNITPIEQTEQEDRRLEDMINENIDSIKKNHFRRGR